MKKRILIVTVAALFIGFACWIIMKQTRSSKDSQSPEVTIDTTKESEGPWPCNADAMMCPDGSSVGRTGPNCEFPPCPPADARFARIETYLGGRDGGLYLTLSPREVISDTRCVPGPACKEKGTIRVKVSLETKVGHGELVFQLGEIQTIGDLKVTLVEVRPATKEETKNPENGYWFVFEARK